MAAELAPLRLPFAEGTAFTVTQGYDTHREAMPLDKRWIVGFSVSPRAEIVAVSEGNVVEAGGSPDGHGRVVLHHPDGHYSYYMTLPPRGIAVHKGQQVRDGERLAFAGNVLHYAYFVRFPEGQFASEKVSFVNGAAPGVIITPVAGAKGITQYKEVIAPPAPPAPPPEPVLPLFSGEPKLRGPEIAVIEPPPLPRGAAQVAPANVPLYDPVEAPKSGTTAGRLASQDLPMPNPGDAVVVQIAGFMDSALPGLSRIAVLGIAILIGVYFWTRRARRKTALDLLTNVDYQQLLRICNNDSGKAQSMIHYEKRREPLLTDAKAARWAIDRWERDRSN